MKESFVICLHIAFQYQPLGNEDKSHGNQTSQSSYVCCIVYKHNLDADFLLNTPGVFFFPLGHMLPLEIKHKSL